MEGEGGGGWTEEWKYGVKSMWHLCMELTEQRPQSQYCPCATPCHAMPCRAAAAILIVLDRRLSGVIYS